jgi:hypothetical protein
LIPPIVLVVCPNGPKKQKARRYFLQRWQASDGNDGKSVKSQSGLNTFTRGVQNCADIRAGFLALIVAV